MNHIPIPVIFFLIFITLTVLLNYLHNKKAAQYHQIIKEGLRQNAIEFDATGWLKAETYKIGRKINDGIAMAKCEMLVTNDAVIILGKTLLNINSNPIIFTKNVEYAKRFAFAKTVMPNKIDLDPLANTIYFEFGEATFKNYLFTIRIHNVDNEFKSKIALAFKSPHL